jgi:hypothetical protein
MEHPLINNIDDLTPEQLQGRISELNKKLSIATKSGNGYLVTQLRMALETFNKKYQEKLRANWDKESKSGPDFSDRIDIS